jgi:hypothetical protein
MILLILLAIVAIPMIFFVWVPKNHLVCVQVFGHPIRILGGKDDKDLILKTIDTLNDTSVTTKVEMKTQANAIVTREDNLHCGWMVTLFNLHFKSFNPLATLRKVKVIRNKPNEEYGNGEPIDKRIQHAGTVETPYLRIAFPRVGIAHDRQFAKNIRNHLAWTINRVVVINPIYVFFENPDISLLVDTQVNAALNNLASTFEFSEFQAEDTSSGDNRLNTYFRDEMTKLNDKTPGATVGATKPMFAGMYKFGLHIASIAILDYELGKDQKVLADALTEQEAAEAKLATAKLQAQGEAAKKRLPGLAEAEVIEAKGIATAKAAEALKTAIGQDPNTTQVLTAQGLAGGSLHTVLLGAAGVNVNLPAPAPQVTPTSTT